MGDPYSNVTAENFNQSPPPDQSSRKSGDTMTDETRQLRTQLAEQQELTRQIALQRDLANNEIARCRAQVSVREQIIAALQQQIPQEQAETVPPRAPAPPADKQPRKRPRNGAEKPASV